MAYPHLLNAPITEALIDLRIDPPFESPDALAPVRDRLKDEFPETRNIIQVQGTLSVSADLSASVPPSSVERRDYGYAMWTADQRRVVQVRTDGFSFSHLKPYGDWAALRADARKAWERFATQARVVRCAVRYVNRIELAHPFAPFEDFFLTFPAIGRSLPQGIAGMYSRVVLPEPPATIVVTQALDHVVMAEKVIVSDILDIDVFVEGKVFASNGEELWEQVDQLRELKNRVFFGSLTSKALELFK
ncbi:MAG: TIGR04255 family protein [Polyangiaceae bacterium]